DADPLTLTALNVPAPLCTFTDNGDTTATLTCSPGYTDAGVYPMTVTVTDPGLLAASETFSLTVNDTNRPPVLDPVAAQTSDEGMLLEVPLTASDPDQNTLVFGGSNLPASCSVSGTGVNTGLLSCQWTFQDAGVHTVTLSVNDGLGGVASQTATLTVNNVNAPPVLAPIATQRPREAFPYGITVLASDVDGEIATIASLVLPTQCTLTDKGDNSADLACSFVLGEAGSYPVSISATDPQGATSQVDFLMSVGVQNRAPVFNPTAAQTGREGQSHSFTVSATDADGDPLNFRSTLSQCATASTGAQSARVTCTWSYYDAGTQTVPLVVTDAYGGAANQNVAVTVANVNGAPAINPVSYQSTKEGIAYTLALSATDPDGDAFTFSVKFIPGSCGLTNNLNGTATLDCNWGYDDSGNYKVTVSAKDTLGNSSSLDITLAVANVNRVPVLDPIGPHSGAEMALVEVPVLAADPDGERIAHYFAGLPRGMKFDGTRKVLYWTPGDRDAGTYDITVTVTDYKGQAAETFRLTIANTNVAPTLSGLPATLTASELSTVTYSLAGTDRDGDPVQVTGSGLPAFCSLTGGGTANATLSCTPGGGTVGTYSGIVLSVSDGLLATTYTPVLTVGPINTAPALAVIAAQTVSEGGALAVAVSGSDPDGDAVTLVAGAMPGFCTFTGAGGSGSVGCNPGFADAGSYSATVSVTDGFLWDTRTFAITVNDVNRVPVLSPIGNQIITETLNLNVSILGSDPDGQAVSFSATGFPGFCTFGDNLNGTATMACSPAKGTAGMYGPIDVVASDGQMVASESITLEVLDPNLIDDVCDGVDNNLNGVVDEGFPAGNTTCGQQVPIRNDVVVVTFDKVAVSGDTNVIRNQPAPALPPGVRKANGTDTYEISATVGFTQAEVCIGYIGALVGSESGLGLYHYAGGVWNNITSNVDKLNDRVCGTTTSFSPFIVGVDIPILVNLDTFSATSDGSSVKLSWVTTAEIDNEGFNVLRSEALAGPYETVNGYLIPARGMGIGG
ncbi:MAG: Ig-like domain-containing protein, partial [Nitrospirota bacterium]|nr:Ig-like domain-containing protein [Nitrospirota bacterium]